MAQARACNVRECILCSGKHNNVISFAANAVTAVAEFIGGSSPPQHSTFFNDRRGCLVSLSCPECCVLQDLAGGEIRGAERMGTDCTGNCDECGSRCVPADATLSDWPSGAYCGVGQAVCCCHD